MTIATKRKYNIDHTKTHKHKKTQHNKQQQKEIYKLFSA
jgi:hypothetical protein